MYADPKHIRQHRVNLSLNEVEIRLIEATAEFCGKQPSVLARELILEGLKAVHACQSEPQSVQLPRAAS